MAAQPFLCPDEADWGIEMLQPFNSERSVSWGVTIFCSLSWTSQRRVLELLQDQHCLMKASQPSYVLHIVSF